MDPKTVLLARKMSTVVVEPEPAWGRDVDHEEARKARAAAVAAGQPSYTVPKLHGNDSKTYWINEARAPWAKCIDLGSQ